jgi:hypothetical protein
MQYNMPSFHAASDQPNEISFLLAASRMQNFAKISGLHIVKLLVFCKHTWTIFFKIKT